MFNFGDPALFAQGVVDQTFYNPATGDVAAFDKVANNAALNYTFEFSEIVGGLGNQLIGLIPHTTRLVGTYTSAAFSLAQRALQTGGSVEYNGIGRVCETVTANGTTLTVTGTPTKFYAQPASDTDGWCYVFEQGVSTYAGTNYHIDLETKQVVDFVAVSGKTYTVVYFSASASAQVLALPGAANPNVVSVVQRWGIYGMQNGSRSGGTMQGVLYVVVPLAMLEGDAGMEGDQTTNATTNYSWRAISGNDNLPVCDVCDSASEALAYYVYVPCGDSSQAVDALVIVSGGVSVAEDATVQIPVKYLMPDGSIVQPNYSDMTYNSAASGTATVSPAGLITGVAAGNTTVTVTLNREGQAALTATCNVTVTA